MSTYQPGIPTGTVDLDEDYQNIQGNFQQLDTTFGIDHTTFSNQTAQNGYHRVIHIIPNTGNPAAVSAIGEVYVRTINDGINTDTALYFQSGLGNVIQLTRNFVPSISANGYTFLPGGLIFQWGTAISNTSSPNSSVTLPLPFPSSIFGVQICVRENSSSRRIWHINTLSTTNFTAYIQDSSGSSVANTFYWTAIGN